MDNREKLAADLAGNGLENDGNLWKSQWLNM